MRTDTIHHFTYDDFGRVLKDDRGGYWGSMSYEYDNLHGCLTKIKTDCHFEQCLYRETGGNNLAEQK